MNTSSDVCRLFDPDMNREKFFALLPGYSPTDLLRTQWSYWFSKEGHRLQTRDTGEPYSRHPRSVAEILLNRGINEPDVICATLMHDLPEDAYVPHGLILVSLGPTVWRWLDALSKKVGHFDLITGQVKGWMKKDEADYRKGVRSLPEHARCIKLADRVHNQATCGGWEMARKAKYVKETREWILPMARETDLWFANTLEAQVEKIEAEIRAAA